MASKTSPYVSSNGSVTETISINGSPDQQLEELKPKRNVPDNKATKKYKHTFAVHAESRTSCLSHDATVTPSFLGFRNLMGLVLVVGNLRLMIENFKKYGLLVTLSGANVSPVDWKWAAVLYFLTPCHLFGAFLIEVAAAKAAKEVVAEEKRAEDTEDATIVEEKQKAVLLTWKRVAWTHGANATAMLIFATYVVYYKIHNPGIGVLTELHSVVVWLKVCSYAFTNRDLRRWMLNKDPETPDLPILYQSCKYPNNITFRNLSYFWWAPTLVYQPVYPMNTTRRWDFIAKRVAEFLFLCVVIWITSAQYAVPLLQNSVGPISDSNKVKVIERLLKLSTISLVCWLAGFFALFQSFLNAIAEITYFADREFYGDWWNVSDIRTYWTSWNKPVTQFMRRHIYNPMVGRGVNPVIAQVITFLFSGFLHELLVGVPTHNITGAAFGGMLIQLVLIYLTDRFRKYKSQNMKLIGNLFFWLTFCVFGQPLAAMWYFYAWHVKFNVDKGTTQPVPLNATKI